MNSRNIKPGTRIAIYPGTPHELAGVVIKNHCGLLTYLQEQGDYPGQQWATHKQCKKLDNQHSNLAAMVRVLLHNQIDIAFETENSVMASLREEYL